MNLKILLASPLTVRILPFALFMAFIALDPVFSYLFAGKDLRLVYSIKTVLVLVVLLYLWRHYTELKTVKGVRALDWALSLAAGVGVFVLWIHLDQPWMMMGEAKPYDPFKPGTQDYDMWLVVFRITGSALVVPIMEELFWRSFLMRWIDRNDFLGLDPRAISARAILICAVLFALEHNLWLAGLIAGLIYNALYWYTRNLWTVILAHGLTNGILGFWVLSSKQWQFW